MQEKIAIFLLIAVVVTTAQSDSSPEHEMDVGSWQSPEHEIDAGTLALISEINEVKRQLDGSDEADGVIGEEMHKTASRQARRWRSRRRRPRPRPRPRPNTKKPFTSVGIVSRRGPEDAAVHVGGTPDGGADGPKKTDTNVGGKGPGDAAVHVGTPDGGADGPKKTGANVATEVGTAILGAVLSGAAEGAVGAAMSNGENGAYDSPEE